MTIEEARKELTILKLIEQWRAEHTGHDPFDGHHCWYCDTAAGLRTSWYSVLCTLVDAYKDDQYSNVEFINKMTQLRDELAKEVQ